MDQPEAITASEDTITRFYDDSARIASWQISLPRRVETTFRRSGNVKVRTREATFSPKAQVETTTVEPEDTDLRTVTTISRGNNNAIQSVETVDSGGQFRKVSFDYDSKDLLPLHVFDALEHSFQVRFDYRSGRRTTAVDPNGIVEQWVYDGFGRLRRHVAPGHDETLDYEVRPAGSENGIPVLAQTSVRSTVVKGIHETVAYDAFGREVQVLTTGLDGALVAQEFAYDAKGLMSDHSRPHFLGDASQGVVHVSYDERGRVTSVRNPNGAEYKYAYGSSAAAPASLNGLFAQPGVVDLVSETKPNSQTTVSARDVFGYELATLDELQKVTQRTYGAFNALTSVTDGVGNSTIFSRDQLGNLKQVIDPDTGVQLAEYTAFGELKSHTDANGKRTWQYDPLGRLSNIREADGRLSLWAYDGPGANAILRLVQTTSPSGHQVNYGYEGPFATENRGFLSTISHSDGASNLDMSFAYDATGNLTHIEYPSAAGTSFAIHQDYDDFGHVIGVRQELPPGQSGGEQYWTLLSAYEGYRIGQERLGSHFTTEMEYSPSTGTTKRIATTADGAGTPAIQDLQYDYWPNDSLRTRNNVLSQDGLETFLYDSADRLQHRTLRTGNAQVTETYEYDDIGNVASVPGIQNYEYNTLPHFASRAGDNRFEPDGNGNVHLRSGPDIPGGTQTIEYTPFNLPSSIAVGTPARLTRFDYDASEQRVSKTDPEGNVTRYFPDMYERRPIGAANGGGSDDVLHIYRIYAGGREIAQVQRAEQHGSIVPNGDKTIYLLGDSLGSVNVTVDGAGDNPTVQRYSPFGRNENPNYDSTGVLSGFTGHQDEAEFGLVNMRGRFYDPIIGRFITPDPFRDVSSGQSLNPYSYALNNPLKYVDPTGFGLSQLPDIFGQPTGGSGAPSSGEEGDCLADQADCKGGSAKVGDQNVVLNPVNEEVTDLTGTMEPLEIVVTVERPSGTGLGADRRGLPGSSGPSPFGFDFSGGGPQSQGPASRRPSPQTDYRSGGSMSDRSYVGQYPTGTVRPDQIARLAAQVAKWIEGAAGVAADAVLIVGIPLLLMSGDEPQKGDADKAIPARPKSKVERAPDTRTKIESGKEAQEQIEDLQRKQAQQRKQGKPNAIRDTTKSQQKLKTRLERIQTPKDGDEEFGD